MFNCYTPEQPSHKPKLIYYKGDYDAIRHEAEKWNWYSNGDLKRSSNYFKYNLSHFMDKHFPQTKQNQRNKKKRPNYMTKKAVEKVKDKNNIMPARGIKQSGPAAKQKNSWKRKSREAKDNPKAFLKYE